jgi:hypothetical protein
MMLARLIESIPGEFRAAAWGTADRDRPHQGQKVIRPIRFEQDC